MTRKPMTPAQWEAKNAQQREYERKIREREAYAKEKSDAEMDGEAALWLAELDAKQRIGRQ